MKKYLLLLLAVPLMMACECETRKFTEIATINFDKTFNINQAGPFDEKVTITHDEVLDEFDIPENATIKDVSIESMSAKVKVLEGNVATSILVSGYLQLGSTKPDLFDDYPLVLSAVNAPWVGLNSLIAGGISKIKTKIEAYLQNNDYEPFDMHVEGDTKPFEGQNVNVQLVIRITGSAKYEVCEEWPWFLEGGESCDI